MSSTRKTVRPFRSARPAARKAPRIRPARSARPSPARICVAATLRKGLDLRRPSRGQAPRASASAWLYPRAQPPPPVQRDRHDPAAGSRRLAQARPRLDQHARQPGGEPAVRLVLQASGRGPGSAPGTAPARPPRRTPAAAPGTRRTPPAGPPTAHRHRATRAGAPAAPISSARQSTQNGALGPLPVGPADRALPGEARALDAPRPQADHAASDGEQTPRLRCHPDFGAAVGFAASADASIFRDLSTCPRLYDSRLARLDVRLQVLAQLVRALASSDLTAASERPITSAISA